jgi:protein-tyrosine phosphatase
LAEALLRARLSRLGVTARVSSAGIVNEGLPATVEAVEVAAALGLDTSGHRSRLLTAEAIEQADLVVGLAREHVREALVLVPQAWPKTYTLKELVRRGEATGARTVGQPLNEWLEKVHAGRTRMELLGRSTDDDVADPIGRGRSVYERMGVEIDDLVAHLVDLAWAGAGERS